jgi:proteasome beta subunit
VVMAGDRRATEGYSIAHRSIEKVFPADRHSAVAFAGAAGPGIEMVKLFQTQLEHYEKVEGLALSLEGKANQLGQMIRGNLGMALQGLAVLPLFAGYDLRRRIGRIFNYDLTGGRYEEADFHATGSGGRDARTTIKLGYREGMARTEAIELAIQALYEAADEDIATGGPDVVRGIYPMVATVTSAGFELARTDEVADLFGALIERKRAEGQRP